MTEGYWRMKLRNWRSAEILVQRPGGRSSSPQILVINTKYLFWYSDVLRSYSSFMFVWRPFVLYFFRLFLCTGPMHALCAFGRKESCVAKVLKGLLDIPPPKRLHRPPSNPSDGDAMSPLLSLRRPLLRITRSRWPSASTGWRRAK